MIIITFIITIIIIIITIIIIIITNPYPHGSGCSVKLVKRCFCLSVFLSVFLCLLSDFLER
jgi:hypothetical protein